MEWFLGPLNCGAREVDPETEWFLGPLNCGIREVDPEMEWFLGPLNCGAREVRGGSRNGMVSGSTKLRG